MVQTKHVEWTTIAHCRDRGDDMFGESQDQKRARTLCQACPVRADCLAEALDNRIEWGVWGGMTERERRHLLRQRPDITNWHDVLLGSADSLARVTEARQAVVQG